MPVDTGPQIPVDNGTDPLIQVSNTEPGARPSLPRVTYKIADMAAPPSPFAFTETGDSCSDIDTHSPLTSTSEIERFVHWYYILDSVISTPQWIR